MHITFLIVNILAALSLSAAKYLKEKPPFLTPCYFDDINFNSCFAGNFQPLFKEWKDGVPGLKSVGKLDPLSVKRVKIDQDSGNTLALHADLQNVIITGASNAVVKEASFNRKNWSMYVKVFVPKMRFDSDYKAKGRILTLSLNGNGKSYFETEKVLMAFHINMKLRDEGEYTFSDIQSVKVDIQDVGGFRIHLDNLFGGQRELEDSANALFNENWRQFYEILRPVIEQTVEAILLDRFKKTFNYVPSNYFIADFPRAQDVYG